MSTETPQTRCYEKSKSSQTLKIKKRKIRQKDE